MSLSHHDFQFPSPDVNDGFLLGAGENKIQPSAIAKSGIKVVVEPFTKTSY